MLMSIISHLLSAWFAFLLPCYATFKALSQRPLNDAELQKWAMYWAVIGAFMAFEYTTECFISWLPFYWEIKTLFLLFLSLPQTQGSTYIYTAYLQPFFVQNQSELDAGIIAIQKNVLMFIQGKLQAIWAFVVQAQPHAPPLGSAPPADGPQLSWLVSPNLWRSSVLNVLQPSSASGSNDSVPPSSRATSYQASSSTTNPAPAFPVPQHSY